MLACYGFFTLFGLLYFNFGIGYNILTQYALLRDIFRNFLYALYMLTDD